MDLPKDRVDRYERGVTQTEIVKYLLNFPDGATEPNIREFMKTEFNLTSAKSIKSHLEKLENINIIVKIEQRGGANRWVLNYDLGYSLGKFLLDEILLPLIYYRKNEFLFCNLFTSQGFTHFIKNNIRDNQWSFSIYNYLFYSNEENKPIPKEIETYFHIIYQSLSISPSLFIEMYYAGGLMDIVSSLILAEIQNPIYNNQLEYPEYAAKFLSPLFIDYCKYGTISTKIMGQLVEMSMHYPIIENIDAVFKRLVSNYENFIQTMLYNMGNL